MVIGKFENEEIRKFGDVGSGNLRMWKFEDVEI